MWLQRPIVKRMLDNSPRHDGLDCLPVAVSWFGEQTIDFGDGSFKSCIAEHDERYIWD